MEAALPMPMVLASPPALAPVDSCAPSSSTQNGASSASAPSTATFAGLVQELLVRTAGEAPVASSPLRLSSAFDVTAAVGTKVSSGKKTAQTHTLDAIAQSCAWLATLLAPPLTTPQTPLPVDKADASADKTTAADATSASSLVATAESLAISGPPSNGVSGSQVASAFIVPDTLPLPLPLPAPSVTTQQGAADSVSGGMSSTSPTVASAPSVSPHTDLQTPAVAQKRDDLKSAAVPLSDFLNQISAISKSGVQAQAVTISTSQQQTAGTSTADQPPATPIASLPTLAASHLEPTNPPDSGAPQPPSASMYPLAGSHTHDPAIPAQPAGARDASSQEDNSSSADSFGPNSPSYSSAKPAQPFSQAIAVAGAASPTPAAKPDAQVQPVAIPHQAAMESHLSAASADSSSPSVSSQPSPASFASDSASPRAVSDAQLVQGAVHSEMRISIQSDRFGPIELHARVTGDEVGAAITVEKRDAHAALAVELPALQQALSDKQLRVEHVTLVQSSAHSLAGDSGAGSQAHQQQARSLQDGRQAASASVPEFAPAAFSLSSESEAVINVHGRLSVHA